MTQNPPVARTYRAQPENRPSDEIALDYEGRFLRRRMLRTTGGRSLLVDLEQTTSLDHGGVLVTEDGYENLTIYPHDAVLMG